MRACVVLIKQESIEDTQSVLSAENQTKASFVASLVPVAFCQLLVRIIRVGMGKHRMDLKSLADPSFKPQPSSGSMWKVLSKALHSKEPSRAMRESTEEASQRPTKLMVLFWRR